MNSKNYNLQTTMALSAQLYAELFAAYLYRNEL